MNYCRVAIKISQLSTMTDLRRGGRFYCSFFCSSVAYLRTQSEIIIKISPYLPKLSQNDCIKCYLT